MLKSVFIVLTFFYTSMCWSATTIYKFTVGPKTYLVAVVQGYTIGANADLDKPILAAAEEWVFNEYKQRGRITDPAMLEAIRTVEGFDDGRSSLVVIFDYDKNLKGIQATLRISTSSEQRPLLPLETRLNIKLERPPLVVGPYIWTPENHVGPFNTSKYAVGDTVELKSFVVSQKADFDFVPFLYWMAEQSRITTYGSQIYNGKSIFDVTNHEDFVLRPTSYVLECDRAMTKYYKSLGFREVNKIGDTYIMEISRGEFVAIREKLSLRPGYETLKTAQLESYYTSFFREVIRDGKYSDGVLEFMNRFNQTGECAEILGRFNLPTKANWNTK